jgi:hypothetical protein
VRPADADRSLARRRGFDLSMGTRTGATAILACAAALALVPTAAAKPAPRVPAGFVGVVADGPIAEAGADPTTELSTMVASGVESVRLVFHWSDAQPHRRLEDVPADARARFTPTAGAPTDFGRFDTLVAETARRGLRVLPVVTTAPGWAAKPPGGFASPPSNPADYAAFARALVERYGPRGSLWRERPDLPRRPIRKWQIWNEPNLRASWSEASWVGPYLDLLRAARRSIRAADPGARIVLAGFANLSWRSLAAVYRQPGARRLFDEVAIHPYTRQVGGLATILGYVRAVMRRNGDARKPISVTEFGWPSAQGKAVGFGIETTERGQAVRVARALRLLARVRVRLGIAAVYWYTWSAREQGSDSIFPYSALRRHEPTGTVTSKPALRAFRATALTLEHCRAKSKLATRCARPRR